MWNEGHSDPDPEVSQSASTVLGLFVCLFGCSKSFFRLSLLFMYFTYIVFSCISQTHHVPALPTAASRGHEVRKVVNFLVGALWVLETEPGSLGRVVPA